MIAPGSVACRPSPAASGSQSAQAAARLAAGSPDGLVAANFGPKRTALSSGWPSGWRLAGGGQAGAAGVARWVHVAGVGQHVRARPQLGQARLPAVPAQHHDRAPVRADEVERVVPGQGVPVFVQLGQGARTLGGRAQRQVAAGPAAAGRGELAPAVQDAADPGHVRVHRQPGAAGSSSRPPISGDPAQWRAGGCQGRPVNSSRIPRSSSGTGFPGSRLTTTVHIASESVTRRWRDGLSGGWTVGDGLLGGWT